VISTNKQQQLSLFTYFPKITDLHGRIFETYKSITYDIHFVTSHFTLFLHTFSVTLFADDDKESS